MGIIAQDSADFDLGLVAVDSLVTYLQEFSTDGLTKNFYRPQAFGIDAIQAQTDLFTKMDDAQGLDQCEFPRYMDPTGAIMDLVRQKSYCYTADNVVQYAESAKGVSGR